MHSILFVATIPAETSDWSDFLANLQTKLHPRGNETRYGEALLRLAENVWLLDLTASPAPLGWLSSMAQQRGIQYGILPLDSTPKWLPTAFKPEDWKPR